MHFREVVKLRNHALNIYTEINLRLLKNKTKKPRTTAARIFERGELPTPASADSPRNFLGGLLRSPASGCTTQRSSTSLQGRQGSVLRQDTSEKMKPEAPPKANTRGRSWAKPGRPNCPAGRCSQEGFPGRSPDLVWQPTSASASATSRCRLWWRLSPDPSVMDLGTAGDNAEPTLRQTLESGDEEELGPCPQGVQG